MLVRKLAHREALDFVLSLPEKIGIYVLLALRGTGILVSVFDPELYRIAGLQDSLEH